MDLINKYKPQLISELEVNYDNIKKYLDEKKTFIINGPKYCGKSTILKLYLKVFNYDYLLIDDYNISKESIIEKIKFRTKSVFSYFYNKKFIVVIDNFDFFDTIIKDYIINNYSKYVFVIITNKFLHSKINYVRINNYSTNYILDLYCNIFFLETGVNCKFLPNFNNIYQMFSSLQFNLNSISNESINIEEQNDYGIDKINKMSIDEYQLLFDKFNFSYTQIVEEKNFSTKIYILDKINSYSVFHNNIVYNYKNIDYLSNAYEQLSCSLNFYNCDINYNSLNEYYSILSVIGTSYKLYNFKIYKENFQIRKNKKFKNNNLL